MTKARELADLIANVNNGSSLANKNLVINGAMNVAQRGTSFTTTSAYTLDRWTFQTDLLDQYAHTVTQSTDTPEGFASSLKIEVTTSETSVETTEDLAITHKIEAQNLQHLQAGTSSAKSLTLSFYVKSSVTGVYAVHLQAVDDSKIFPTTYTINSANTWEYKTITIPPCTIATIDNDTGEGLRLTFITISGSTYTGGSTGSWQSYASNLFAAGHQANVSSDGDTWLITGVQLEVGEKATEFEHEPYEATLNKCYRYYYKHVHGQSYMMGMGDYYVTTQLDVIVHMPVPMRAVPSLVQTSGSGYYLAYGGATSETMSNAWNLWVAHHHAFSLYGTPASNGTAGQARRVISNDTSAMIAMNAEL